MAKPIRILLVENDPETIRTIWNMLHEKSRFQFSVESVTGLPEALERLTANDMDIVLLDLALVSYQAEEEAIQAILEAQPQIALIVLTELENEQAGLQALEAGAQDYLLKEEIGRYALVRALHYAVERQRALTLIQAAEERHRVATNSVLDYAFITLDMDGKITDWSRGAEHVFGYDEEAAVGQGFEIIFTPEDRQAGVPRQKLVNAEQQGFEDDERWLLHQDGTRFYGSGTLHPIYAEKGDVQGFIKIVSNRTKHWLHEQLELEKRKLAEALRDTAVALNSALNLEAVLEQALTSAHQLVTFEAGVVVLVEHGKLTHFETQGINDKDRAKLEAWHRQQPSLNNTPLYKKVTQTRQALIIENGKGKQMRLPILPDHTLLVALLSTESKIIGYITFANRSKGGFSETDIPKIQAFSYQVVFAIQNAKNQLHAQELAVIHERQRLARDLHDAVTQTLFSASIILQSVQRKGTQKSEELPQLLETLERLIQGANAEMRTLLLELRPDNLQRTLFTTLLRQLITSAQARKVMTMNIEFEGEPSLPAAVHMMIYRIAQEAVNNIIKHAQASELWISGHGKDGFIELHIRDNGQGFATDEATSGLGLQIMRERAAEINAGFEIHSTLEHGTEIRVVWPHQEKPSIQDWM